MRDQLKISDRAAALLEYLWRNPDCSRADLRAAGFTATLITRWSGGRDGSHPKMLRWDPRVAGYRLTRSGKAAILRHVWSLAA
jgi:hypothetical protein